MLCRVPANKSGRMFAFRAASVIIRDDVFQARDVSFLLSITLMSLVDSSNQEFYGRKKCPRYLFQDEENKHKPQIVLFRVTQTTKEDLLSPPLMSHSRRSNPPLLTRSSLASRILTCSSRCPLENVHTLNFKMRKRDVVSSRVEQRTYALLFWVSLTWTEDTAWKETSKGKNKDIILLPLKTDHVFCSL